MTKKGTTMILYFIAVFAILGLFEDVQGASLQNQSELQEIKTILSQEQIAKLVQEGIKIAQSSIEPMPPESGNIPQSSDSAVLNEQDLTQIMQTLLAVTTLKKVVRTKEDDQNRVYTAIATLSDMIAKKSTQTQSENILKRKILETLFVMSFKMLKEKEARSDAILDTSLISQYFKWERDKQLPMTIDELKIALKRRKNPATVKCPIKDLSKFLSGGDPTAQFKEAARICDPWKLKEAIDIYDKFKASSAFKDKEAMEKYIVSQYYLRVLQRLNQDLAKTIFKNEKKQQEIQKKKMIAQYNQEMKILEAESVRKQQMIALFAPGRIEGIKKKAATEQDPVKKSEYQNLITIYDAQSDASAAQISGQPVVASVPVLDEGCKGALLKTFSKVNRGDPAKCLIAVTQKIMESRRGWRKNCKVVQNLQEIQIIELLHNMKICSSGQDLSSN